ncbi:MAG TPA: DUF5060 domain-containing protein [Armatimonadetes bacterium]|nr:DUF5060 domain-containing protein [Armatimonadota bacterium]
MGWSNFVFLLGLLLALGSGGAQPLRIAEVKADRATVGRYQRLELTIRLTKTYDNPFDPAQIAVEGHFSGPSGREVTVPAFYCVPYRNVHPEGSTFTNPGRERWEQEGEPCFKVRFAPTEVGTHRGYVTARDADGEARSPDFTFACLPSDNPGFLRVSRNNPRYFVFDDGKPFLPIGMCIAWARREAEGDTYDHYFARLVENGGNAVRVWMCHWAWLEWTRGEQGSLRGYEGVGRYNQMVAANFDNLLELARRHGLYLMLCFNNACWEFGRPDGKHGAYDSWGGNPYNAANGGPCATPGEFWTNPEARALYKRKLRYIVARWSYSPNVLAWELWNETGQENEATVAWHQEMAAYLRQTDPNRHLVTTSSWVSTPQALRRTFAALDFCQLHYAPPAAIAEMRRVFPTKPLLIGEGTADGEGVGFHNSLWVAVMMGAAGAPLTWHAGRQCPVELHDRYGHYRALAEFLRGENLAAGAYEPFVVGAAVASTGSSAASARSRYRPVLIKPLFFPWLRKAPQSEFPVPPDGRVDARRLGCKLYGSNPDRAPYRNPPTFLVNYPMDGEFVVVAGEMAGLAILEVFVDDQLAVRHEFSGKGRRHVPAEERQVVASVPAGPHRIRVHNAGHDWIQVSYYLLTNYRDAQRYPEVTVYGLRSPRRVLLWVHHSANEPEVLALGQRPEEVRSATVTLTGLREGDYLVEWWDSYAGKRQRTERVTCQDGRITLSLPPVQTDYAGKVKAVERVGEPAVSENG